MGNSNNSKNKDTNKKTEEEEYANSPRYQRFEKLKNLHPDVHCLQVFKLQDFEDHIDGLVASEKLTNDATFYDLLKYLLANNVWLIEHFPSRRSIEQEVFDRSNAKIELVKYDRKGSSKGWFSVSYWWGYKIRDFINTIKSPASRPMYKYGSEDYMWLDIVCIKQFSNNVPINLGYLEPIYIHSKYHMIVGIESFKRGWVQFEFCIELISKMQDLQPNGLLYDLHRGNINFSNAKFTFDTDRAFVEAMIVELYGNIDEYNKQFKTKVTRMASRMDIDYFG